MGGPHLPRAHDPHGVRVCMCVKEHKENITRRTVYAMQNYGRGLPSVCLCVCVGKAGFVSGASVAVTGIFGHLRACNACRLLLPMTPLRALISSTQSYHPNPSNAFLPTPPQPTTTMHPTPIHQHQHHRHHAPRLHPLTPAGLLHRGVGLQPRLPAGGGL